jgi:hypothetical protein
VITEDSTKKERNTNKRMSSFFTGDHQKEKITLGSLVSKVTKKEKDEKKKKTDTSTVPLHPPPPPPVSPKVNPPPSTPAPVMLSPRLSMMKGNATESSRASLMVTNELSQVLGGGTGKLRPISARGNPTTPTHSPQLPPMDGPKPPIPPMGRTASASPTPVKVPRQMSRSSDPVPVGLSEFCELRDVSGSDVYWLWEVK